MLPGLLTSNEQSTCHHERNIVSLCLAVVWHSFQENYYLIGRSGRTFEDAEQICQGLGIESHLASLQSPEENEFVTQLVNSSTGTFWIGAMLLRTSTPQLSPFIYVWADNSAWRFDNFQPGQPDDHLGEEDCLATVNGEWIDAQCSFKLPYICKRPGET